MKHLVDGLRAAADWFEAHPEYAPTHQVGLDAFVYDRGALRTAALALGRAEKGEAAGCFYLRKWFSPSIRLDMNVARDKVCTAVVVGKETVTEKVATGYEEQAVERDVIEWRCDPLFAKVPDAA